MMTFPEKKALFESRRQSSESALLRFDGVDGFDVYNCSVPFDFEGHTYLFGRVEKRSEWARSHTRLFRLIGPDHYAAVEGSMMYPLEDPYISQVRGSWVMGGTHVVRSAGKLSHLYAYFYAGQNPYDLDYFTTGPVNMKDIRLVELAHGIGVFSRPRSEQVLKQYGSESVVGFTIVDDLLHLTSDVIQDAPVISNMFAPDEWGGCNQCYLLDSSLIGIIGHRSYAQADKDGTVLAVYANVSFVFDPKAHRIVDEKIIATRASFPQAPAKKPELVDCAFASGIRVRPDGRFDLYSGVGDTCQGRTVIDDPFKGFGQLRQGMMSDK